MLGLIFRGVFLVGILTWYSTAVWKMIDGYFRDQFRSYLEEEYRKNPQMKSDVQNISADKIDPVTVALYPDSKKAEPFETQETLEIDRETNRTQMPAIEAVKNDSDESTEKLCETVNANRTIDKNKLDESELKNIEEEQDIQRSIVHQEHDLESEESDDRHRSIAPLQLPNSESTRKKIKRSAVPTDANKKRLSKKEKMRATTHIEKNFKLFDNDRVSNNDFWEFEEDGNEKERLEGTILVAELPFKPRADIGNLERISAEEYCPLNLDDESSCDETFKWP